MQSLIHALLLTAFNVLVLADALRIPKHAELPKYHEKRDISDSNNSVTSTFATNLQTPVMTLCPTPASNRNSTFNNKLVPLLPFPSKDLELSDQRVGGSPTPFMMPSGANMPSSVTELPGGVTALPRFDDSDNVDPNAARIIQGDDGCQTIFAPRDLKICSTTLSPFGIPPVTVTECDQMVTFSSETGVMTMTPLPVPTNPVYTNTTSLLDRFDGIVPRMRHDKAMAIPPAVTYYRAPWDIVAKGGVPPQVEGVVCSGGLTPSGACAAPDTDGDPEECECTTIMQNWHLTMITAERVGTTIALHSGLMVYSSGTVMTSTTLDLSAVLTTTRTISYGSVMKTTIPSSSALLDSIVPLHPQVTESSTDDLLISSSLDTVQTVTVTSTVAGVTMTRY